MWRDLAVESETQAKFISPPLAVVSGRLAPVGSHPNQEKSCLIAPSLLADANCSQD